MAALVAGVEYGLSSQDINYENKSLIFVKLTDSAIKAIEEHLKNRNKSSKEPSIRFQGNEGQLTFPSLNPNGQVRFNFSLSSNEDIEGPQGSFECIQATGQRSLAALGALACKMRIHAKEDIYEATRQRVAEAEDQQKKNCTRVIKPSEIGGKSRSKRSKFEAERSERLDRVNTATLNPLNPLVGSGPGGRRDHSRMRPKAPAPAAAPTPAFAPAVAPAPSERTAPHSAISMLDMHGYQRNVPHTKPQGNNHAQKPGNPDITRRPLRERLIHILALRQYKRPEILDRFKKDGLREKDKVNFWGIIAAVATMKNNAYNLKREIWTEVDEDWPFYSEQDRQMLKRRKPQNLTPPGSSDGGSSASSGQSPNSTHPGSPPSTIVSGISNKRPGYYESADGFQTKRQRISHYIKPNEPVRNTSIFSTGLPSLDADTDSLDQQNSGWNHVDMSSDQEYQMEPCRTLGGGGGGMKRAFDGREKLSMHSVEPAEVESVANRNRNHNGTLEGFVREKLPALSASRDRLSPLPRPRVQPRDTQASSNFAPDRTNYKPQLQPQPQPKPQPLQEENRSSFAPRKPLGCDSVLDVRDVRDIRDTRDSRDARELRDVREAKEREARLARDGRNPRDLRDVREAKEARDAKIVREAREESQQEYRGQQRSARDAREREARGSSREHRHIREATHPREGSRDSRSAYRDSQERDVRALREGREREREERVPDSHHDNEDSSQPSNEPQREEYEYPDYHLDYTTIESDEQKRRYKEDFNKDYQEYQKLHENIATVKKQFDELERRLRLEEQGSEAYKRVSSLIIEEYKSLRNRKHVENKKRFEYLHARLSHIKKLVHTYDTERYSNSAPAERYPNSTSAERYGARTC